MSWLGAARARPDAPMKINPDENCIVVFVWVLFQKVEFGGVNILKREMKV